LVGDCDGRVVGRVVGFGEVGTAVGTIVGLPELGFAVEGRAVGRVVGFGEGFGGAPCNLRFLIPSPSSL